MKKILFLPVIQFSCESWVPDFSYTVQQESADGSNGDGSCGDGDGKRWSLWNKWGGGSGDGDDDGVPDGVGGYNAGVRRFRNGGVGVGYQPRALLSCDAGDFD